MKDSGNVSSVLDRHLCTSCGTCAGVCPADAIEMVEHPAGILLPYINDALCTNCSLCLKVCPGTGIKTDGNGSDPFVGGISASYAGQVADANLLANSQSGGIVTGLLLHALESGYIDAAVVTSQAVGSLIRPRVTFAEKPEEIINAQQSKYCPVPLNTFLSSIRGFKKRMAVVGLPCHIHGLYNVGKELPGLAKNIVMRIGLFCDRTLTYGAVDSLVRSAGFQNRKIIEFRYRSKKWRGWPGDVYMKDEAGNEMFLPREARLAIKDNFTPLRCRLCFDKLNTFADISVGDSYGIAEPRQGMSSIIVRNENIHKVILGGVKSGKIKLLDVDPFRIVAGQALGVRKKQFSFFASAWERMGHSAPEYDLKYDYTKAPDSIDLSDYEKILGTALTREKYPSPDMVNTFEGA